MADTLTIRLPREMRQGLRLLSKKEKIPLSDIVRESIRRYLVAQQFRKLRDKVLPFAEAQGLLTDDDVFQALK